MNLINFFKNLFYTFFPKKVTESNYLNCDICIGTDCKHLGNIPGESFGIASFAMGRESKCVESDSEKEILQYLIEKIKYRSETCSENYATITLKKTELIVLVKYLKEIGKGL